MRPYKSDLLDFTSLNCPYPGFQPHIFHIFHIIYKYRQIQQLLVVKRNRYKQKALPIININKITQQGMFQLFTFESQLNFDEEEMVAEPQFKMNQMPTTAFNSPGSNKSVKSPTKSVAESFGGISENYELEVNLSVDNSFEIGCQVNHASNIHEASEELYKQSMVNPTTSHNDFSNDHFSFQDASSQSIDEAIKGNRLLRYYQKTNFISQLQNQSELSNLLAELMVLFNPKIFSEMIYVIHTIWNKKYLPYRQTKNAKTETIIPQFSCFFGWNGQQMQREDLSFNCSSASEVGATAEEGIEEFARELFSSKKLKYLNMKEVQGAKQSNEVVKKEFESFMRKVSRSVFLSAEGIYSEPEAEEPCIPSFSEQEQEESMFDCEGMNRFARSYSQLSQDDEEEFSSQSGSKRHKRF